MPTPKNNKRELKIVKGYEHTLHVSDDIKSERSFMNPAYRQAIRALMEIIRQTDKFHNIIDRNDEKSLDGPLFQYCGNVIAFLAQRGGGKTRTMLSISKILSESSNYSKIEADFLENDDISLLNRCKFFVTPPIAPSSLEGNQNILYVVLSRLFCYAEELLQPGGCDYVSEKEKNELFNAFHMCLSGINGIKRQKKDDAWEDLSALQDISDGLSLRKHFYELVQRLIKVAAPKLSCKDCYLVLQIDDADSHIANSYEVLEDIRKYLLIPNLVILMSADVDMLHNSVLQNHLTQFKDLKAESRLVTKELNRMCRKYIDKLIPPSHMVHLPQLDKFLEASKDQLELQYVDENGHSVLKWTNEGNWEFQNLILMLIYRKIGVVFVSPSSYVHNIIPRTLRGLNQLLHFLNGLKDIPKISNTELGSPSKLAHAMKAQLLVAEENLNLFIEYFTNDWIAVKIQDFEDREFLKEFSQTVGSNRVRLALQYLQKRYDPGFSRYLADTRIALDEEMVALENVHRTRDDFLLFFSIRTLFTLESHRMILGYKHKVVYDYLESSSKTRPPVLIFDFDPEKLYLPKTYLLNEKFKNIALGSNQIVNFIETTKDLHKRANDPEDKNKIGSFISKYKIRKHYWDEFINKENPIVDSEFCVETKIDKAVLSVAWDIMRQGFEKTRNAADFFVKIMALCDGEDYYTINVLNFITSFLRIGNESLNVCARLSGKPDIVNKQQRLFYRLQENALLIAANSEIQSRIYKNLQSIEVKGNLDADSNPLNAIIAVFEKIAEIINGINDTKLTEYINSGFNGDYKPLGIDLAFGDFLALDRLETDINIDMISNILEVITTKHDKEKDKIVREPKKPTNSDSATFDSLDPLKK